MCKVGFADEKRQQRHRRRWPSKSLQPRKPPHAWPIWNKRGTRLQVNAPLLPWSCRPRRAQQSSRSNAHRTVPSGDAPQLANRAIAVSLDSAEEHMRSSNFNLVFLELCCAPNSTLSGMPPPGCLAVRITEADDLTKKETAAALHSIIQLASQLRLRVHAWVSFSCTAGCRWRHVNARNGFKTGDVHITDKLVAAAMNICMDIARRGNTYSWEWPEQNDLWRMTRVADLLESTGAMTCIVSSTATGLVFEAVENGLLQHRYLR